MENLRASPETTAASPGDSSSGWTELPRLSDPMGRADGLLRAAILVHVVGAAVALFTRAGSATGDFALMHLGVGHGPIFFWERGAAVLLLLAAVSLFAYPTILALAAIAAVVAFEGYAAHRGGGFPFAEYALWATALRWVTPLALIALVLDGRMGWLTRRCRAATAAWVLRLAVAAVFGIHGLEAIWGHPGFIDLIIGSGRNVFGLEIREATAIGLLGWIGGVDLVIALLILVGTWRPLLGWIAFWGLVTALSRPLAHGWGAYPEVLVRSSHVAAAIAIWWLICAIRDDETKTR